MNADMFDVTLESKPSVASKKTVKVKTTLAGNGKKLSVSRSRQKASMTRLSTSKNEKNNNNKVPAAKTSSKNKSMMVTRPPTAQRRKSTTLAK